MGFWEAKNEESELPLEARLSRVLPKRQSCTLSCAARTSTESFSSVDSISWKVILLKSTTLR